MKKILFEKWIDPLNAEDANWPDFSHTVTDEDIDKAVEFGDDEFSDEEIHKAVVKRSKQVKCMVTEQGIVPINDHTLLSKRYNFYVGHCNFRLTDSYVKTINETDGVESLTISSPYRFQFSIARMFKPSEVKRLLIKNVNKDEKLYLEKELTDLDVKIQGSIKKVRNSLKTKFWAYHLNNGKFKVVKDDNEAVFANKFEILFQKFSDEGGLFGFYKMPTSVLVPNSGVKSIESNTKTQV